MRKTIGAIALGAAILTGASAGIAKKPVSQERPDAFEALIKCRAISDEKARLQCFDAASSAMEQAAARHDLVVIDSPPLLPVADPLELIRHVDSVLMCVRLEKTTREQIHSAAAAMQRHAHGGLDAAVLGAVDGPCLAAVDGGGDGIDFSGRIGHHVRSRCTAAARPGSGPGRRGRCGTPGSAWSRQL